uniref:Alpha/beta hydrolase n=1 Tax=Streptomyces sp. NBC_00049 TaxID=2903617 RepID=A0AAU2JL46_9ACTN
MRSHLVFVHGIGGPRDPVRELTGWTGALAAGMRAAGHSAAARDLTAGGAAHVFVHYADLFGRGQAQGGDAPGPAGDAEAEILSALLVSWVDGLAAESADERDLKILEHARAEAAPRSQEQGSLEVLRRALNVATTVLALKPWGAAARWITPKMMVSHLGQVSRYLARAEHDAQGVGLDRRIRARVAEAIGDGPAVVVAHSLGTVVALEALHELTARIPLFVTLGSPLAMRTVVWPRLVPRPPSVPGTVGKWLNFWDRDDIIAVRPHLERELLASSTGVTPVSRRVDSDGTWVHDAEKYLAQPAVAGPVAEALAGTAGAPGNGGGSG